MNSADIENLIKELIEKTTVPVGKISLEENPPAAFGGYSGRNLWFEVEVSEPHYFWDRGGEALHALNHLVRRIIESRLSPVSASPLDEPANAADEVRKKPGDVFEVLVDINGFQRKRVENVCSIAHTMAERARYFKSNIEVDPMPAFERRIVHESLSDASDLKTESTGEGSTRRVVIKYVGSI